MVLVVRLRHLHPPDSTLGANVGVKKTTSKLLVLVELLNLTFDLELDVRRDSNVKFAPLVLARRSPSLRFRFHAALHFGLLRAPRCSKGKLRPAGGLGRIVESRVRQAPERHHHRSSALLCIGEGPRARTLEQALAAVVCLQEDRPVDFQREHERIAVDAVAAKHPLDPHRAERLEDIDEISDVHGRFPRPASG
ncbi:hypothetical protein CHELA40_14540 [Chelatococcus asaccharovorans]|nr:hypothetical protein CHELA17_61078 [Chelatococcus asaccharovorans]CAH1678244.1 hypothetical protein CHELA40_14540 [Chelatococcus asaccharovorans]